MKKIQMIKNQPLSLISTTKIIQMSNVSTSYDSKNFVLKGINLSIDRGTNYAIVGQTGSGKSTFLKLMKGMIVLINGTIKLDYVVSYKYYNKLKDNRLFSLCSSPVRYNLSHSQLRLS